MGIPLLHARQGRWAVDTALGIEIGGLELNGFHAANFKAGKLKAGKQQGSLLVYNTLQNHFNHRVCRQSAVKLVELRLPRGPHMQRHAQIFARTRVTQL
jgi:hypothetical protein